MLTQPIPVFNDKATKLVRLDAIRVDGGTQSRAELSKSTISEYAESMRDGANFPPVVLYYDGDDYWLADGFHRYRACEEFGGLTIPADVRQGSRRDAVLYSVGANASHGLRRTNEDKRRAVTALLSDSEWSAWSDREIARACGVYHTFVASIRKPEVASAQAANKKASQARKDQSQDATPVTNGYRMESDSILYQDVTETSADSTAPVESVTAPVKAVSVTASDDDAEDERTELAETCRMLADQVRAYDAIAHSEEARLLVELQAVNRSLNSRLSELQNENAQLKKQIKMLNKRLGNG